MKPKSWMYKRALVHALYLGLSLLFATHFFSLTRLTSHAMTNGDPALNAWALQWMSHALVHDPLHWWAGNTFYPYPHAIVLSDPLVPLAILNVPIRWFTSNPWVGYNLLIVAAYYLSCVSGAALAGLVTGSRVTAVWGGIFWGFLFYSIWGENTLYIGYVLALGYVSPSLGIRLPLHYAARWLPVVAGLRATQRFSLVLYTGILLLSSLGLARIIRTWRPRRQAAATALVCAVFLVEVFPIALPISAAHEYGPSAPDRFIAQYQKTRSEPLVVLHLPIFYLQQAYPVDEATYMVDSTWHWARILNGFSGGEPLGFMERMRTLNTLPEPAAVNLVRELGVDVIAVHGAAAHAGNPLWDFFSQQDWTRVVRFPNDEFVVMMKR